MTGFAAWTRAGAGRSRRSRSRTASARTIRRPAPAQSVRWSRRRRWAASASAATAARRRSTKRKRLLRLLRPKPLLRPPSCSCALRTPRLTIPAWPPPAPGLPLRRAPVTRRPNSSNNSRRKTRPSTRIPSRSIPISTIITIWIPRSIYF